MSSEIRLATSHSDFWTGLLPMGDAFIRAQNSKPHRFGTPVVALTTSELRGVINEAGFLLFKESLYSVAGVVSNSDAVARSFESASAKIGRLPRAKAASLPLALLLGENEARAMAQNLLSYFAEEDLPVQVNPPIPGCGWVSDVEADILCGTTLYEVKAGDRHFRLSDLRQLLTYCALNFSSKTYEVSNVALINPRSGKLIKVSLDNLCLQIAGASAVRILGEIVSFISEPTSTYSE